MNDLQKDQAIYKAMYEIAQEIVCNAVKNDTKLQEHIRKYGKIDNRDIFKRQSPLFDAIAMHTPFDRNTKKGIRHVQVDTFSCEFPPMIVFILLEDWKTLAKVKGDIFFTCEEKLSNKFIGSVDITFDDPAGAKTLATCTLDDDDVERTPILKSVLVEINLTTKDINFVCTDAITFAVISNNTAGIARQPADGEEVLQALFTKADWKRICEHAAKNISVNFQLYKRNDDELQDTMVATIGENTVKSFQAEMQYPKWHKVVQQKADKHFRIHPAHVKAAQKWLKSFKSQYDKDNNIFVSFYRGSEYVYFDFNDLDFGTKKSAAFLLESPSDVTIGTCFKIKRLQKMKFQGFHLENESRSAVIDTPDTDLTMLMPVHVESGVFTFDVESREVLATSEVLAPSTAA
jgi:hypothetical protein